MRDPHPVFIDLLRLKQTHPEAFNWTMTHLSLEKPSSDEEVVALGARLQADIIKVGHILILRGQDDTVVYDTKEKVFVDVADAGHLLDTIPRKNPLRG